MKNYRVEQYDFIRKDEEGFQEKLNARLRELYEKHPKVTVTNDDVQICYTEQIEIEKPTVSEIGITFTCSDCPIFKPRPKRDGTPDYRSKYGDCPYAEMHRTWKNARACENLYMMIKNGDIGLTINEPDTSVIMISKEDKK